MFEAHVLHLLRKYLGEYVHGLSTEALRISVWKGDVILKDLKLKAEALNSLKLPVTVTAGFVGTITLKVPWKSLGKEPVVVLIDRVFILAHPAPDGQSLKEEDRERIFEAKLRQIEEAELATLEATNRGSKAGNPPGGSSWLSSLIATIIGNLKITISNVHVRYEDSVSNPGHPFCSGVTLAKLAAVTTDELGNETFDTSGALDKLQKSLYLQRLAVYHDSDCCPWKAQKKWEELTPKEWVEIFADGINEIDDEPAFSSRARSRQYLVSPINGVLKYHRLGKDERHEPNLPFEKASLVLADVSLTILETQYYDGIKLLETFSRYKTRVDVSHLRPVVPVSKHAHLWWRYAVQASLQQKKMCYRFSWERIRHLCHLRRCYVQLYASSLQHCTKADSCELRQIERDLDSKVILLWRLLAHAKVESVKSKEATLQSGALKRSWWSFGWGGAPGDASIVTNPAGTLVEEKLSKEEWQVLNKMLSYELDEDTLPVSGKGMQIMIQFLVDISIEKAATRIVSIDQTEVLCGRFEQLRVTTKLYHKSTHCEVSLQFCGLSSPEGSLAQSVSNENKEKALAATFIHSPIGDKVDWSLSATIAPCHVTVDMKSYERFIGFMKRSNAVSPMVALETATALQMKIEQVTRRAQEQFQMVIKEQSRFSLDIDFDAPKVRIPFGDCSSDLTHGNFLLDFGHFTLHTQEREHEQKRESIYSRFNILGRDIAAFFLDGCSEDCRHSNLQTSDDQPSMKSTSSIANVFHSLIDRCRMSVVVDQVKIPHPSYPSTRVSIEIPNLGIHFSPTRYQRIFELLNIFYRSTEANDEEIHDLMQPDLAPWYPADLASEARVLVWRGIGSSLAEWRPCFLVLSGVYLYVLESETSQSYQRCCSMVGRHVFEVSPASVGGSLFSIAASLRGTDIQKALESSSTLIVEFRGEVEKVMWLKGLVQATYQASAFPLVYIPEKLSNDVDDARALPSSFPRADLVINGSLFEAKLSIYGKLDRDTECSKEELFLEILAGGGKVNLLRSSTDMSFKMKLHFLKIRDILQGHNSASLQYLACSVVKHDLSLSHASAPRPSNIALHDLEEDDVFRDALPDFVGTSDQNFDDHSMDMVAGACSGYIDDCELFTQSIFVDDKNSGNARSFRKSSHSEIFYEAEDDGSSDFVVVTFMTRYPDSPLYDGTDTQMSICMSKLDFFCNRPTLVALLDFGFDISLANLSLKSRNGVDITASTESSHDREGVEDSGRAVVKGLLGHGKRRILFHLRMIVDSVYMFLNREDGSQFAVFVQEKFLLDFKSHPSSISLEGTLGNFRLCDMSLGPDHWWGWLCDVRDQRNESLIKFIFRSFSADDDDYAGHDYSLSGQLSAVRIVFLYRFVQEVMAYFMELATPHTEEVIKFVDKVGGFEWLIKKYEIDGSSSLKLNLSLDTPVIVVPYNSMSKSFLQLDLGKLHITNSFRWHGEDKDPSAVRLDILHAEMRGINLAVGLNGNIGEPMIKEGQWLTMEVRRSLRDVFRKVPTACVEVKVGSLHCVMSDKEYSVIRDCAYTNIYELPNLPPSFRGNANATKESIRLLADKVNFNSQILLSRTIVIMAVDVQHALLELRNGRDEESPLAQIVLEGLWVSYRYSSLSEADLYVSIPKFSILDIRSDIKPEMRLMLGSSSDAYKQGLSGNQLGEAHSWTCSDAFPCNSRDEMYNDGPNLTMLIMDYRWRSSSQSFVIRMQQPRVLVVLDFLVAVTEFFVPSLRSLTGREESVDPKNDPLTRSDNIIISEPIHIQSTDVICLSHMRKLIVDGPGFDEVVYDGCGGTILLNEESGMHDHVASGCNKFPFIIIVGRGKRLRFKNVKIENGDLLSKYTYLCNDSSYSVNTDDGVEIFFPDNYGADALNVPLIKSQHLSACTDDSNELSENNFSNIQSFSFEAQALSPELTFYDSTRVFLDDVTQMEKLLRAKMDFSFMYASKGYDIWVRSHVKDLTVEAGSGLAVLDPVDISGGYTSVKDKTNISIGSTDICIHLSLSVASLILHLQHQAFTALQFGNMDPVTSCTNFKKIWVSQKGNKYGHKLTFWRPQAPPNYAILGDCVTSRPIAPSQIIMAVSNSYGRLRKPLGFKLMSFISDMMELDEEGCQSEPNSGCSIWLPIAPPGYLAMGCVAHVGRQAPPNHVVYCIRSDLVTSARFSECMATIPPSHRASSGFSIWRVDNVACSFAAHTSAECPSISVFDLHHILLGSTNIYSLTTRPSLSSPNQRLNGNQLGDEPTSNLSGWDVLRSFSKPGSCYISTPHFERIWWDKGCDLRKTVSFWRPLPRQGFCVLGDCLTEGLEPPTLGLLFKCDSSEISAKPMQFTRVAHVARKGLDDAYFWYPVPPPGYASLGCVITKTDEAPNKDSFCCPRMDLISQSNISEYPFSRSSSSKGSNCWSLWKVENQANTFLARPDHKRPSSRLAYCLSDYVKPKTRENISAEMKIGSFSLTILDGLCGMMTPLFDSTITNFNLATHGRLEAMNAVLICSVAASTFNRQLEAWEPLLEPFEGIFKVETYEASENALARVGKRIRIAATSIVNLNLSAGNLDTLVESVVSWRKQADLEQRSLQKSAELDGCKASDDSAFSALDEDDLEKVTLENKLGCDLYVKNIVQGSESVVLLSHGNEASVSLPPPRFSDKLNIIAESMESRTYVAIKIFHAKELPVEDDGNGLEFFCALRLVIESSMSVRNKLFPQSARTRCLRPSISKVNGIDVGTVKWNEIFLFEVPEKVPATLELEITNLASKTGKGEVVGAMSIPIRSNVNTLKRVGSIRMLLESSGTGKKSSYTLRPKGQISGNLQDCGNLYVSADVFERSSISNFQGGFNTVPFRTDKEVSFSVGLSPEGPWESFGSFLPLSVFPKLFDEKALAFEVTMQNGHKHAIFRPLALIVNYTNVKLEVSLCSASRMASIHSEMRNDGMVKIEEIFENQWYEPTSGWGSKCPSPQFSGPARWSTRDFSYSSKDFLDIPLPVGWKWTSAWTIEKTEHADGDGWVYGTDLRSITWPPNSLKSSKSTMDFFRRRRWVRTREQMQRGSLENMSTVVAVVSPGSSASLPWSCMMTDTDICLQIRPYDEISGFRYSWGQMLSVTSTCSSASNDSSVDQGPFSRQNTLKNNNFQLYPSALMLNRLGKMDLILCCDCCVSRKQHFWLTVGIDASVLQTEMNVPVYDWKINVNTPLRIENKLPYPAEISIWENVEGNNVERQHGVVLSGNTFYVYSADLRKPIYLTLLIQSDWIMEKDTIVIMDLLSWNHASSFWMVHRKSKRRLRVSVEHDLGGCIATPKIIRLFVPYWIQNESSVPLSYRIVEVDSWETGDADSLSISKAVKSARSVLRHTSSSISNSRKYDQTLEVIEEPNSPCIMLSPQDYSNRVSRNESLLSQRVGISIAACHSESYGLGISLHEFENKERVDVKAFTSNGAYYKLSAVLSMAFDRTKVVCFQPYMLFINRVGFSICLKQADGVSEDWLHPTDPLKLFQWQYGSENELLMVRLDGYRWSSPFSVKNEGLMCISLRTDDGNEQMHLWTEVQSGFKGSPYEVVFRPASYSSPYRIENRSVFLSIRFRQVDCLEDSWRSLPPNSSASFCWEDLGGQQLLEVLVDGTDPSKSEKYNIDIVRDYQPVQTFSGPMKAIYLAVLKDGRTNVVRIDDWRPQNQCLTTVDGSFPAHFTQSSELDSSVSDGEFHMTLELAEFGFSIVDHTPEEIMYLSLQNLFLSFSTGLGSGVSRFNLRIVGLQVDNQLPFTPMPVLFRPQRIGDEADDYVLKLSLTMQSSSQDLSMYPFIGMQGPESSAFLVNIHEPIIWRLHEMVKQAKLSRMYSTQTTAVPIDPIVQIRLLNISEFRFKLSMSMSPNQRPGGVLGFWSSLMTALGNMENMTVRINQRCRENVCTRQSTLVSSAISNIQKDLLSQPLRLLSGVDILGNASSALGHMSKGVAALSMDKKFIQSRQKQESKTVEDFGDVIREGGGALAKGLFRGVTGILTKPLEGAKSSGVEGFVQGVGKGIIGVAAQPVSGVLDLLSKTTEGANAVRMKIASAITSEEQLLRRRLPRAIGGDNLLRPYDEYKASGQAILQLAESGAFFGQVDLFKVRGKFALSDAYEDHFLLPKGKVLLISHRRVLQLQQPTNIVGQRKFNAARDPCSVLWDVLWDDLMSMELAYGNKDPPSSPSRLILYSRMRPTDSRENIRVIKCRKDRRQANDIYTSVDRAMNTYGPNRQKREIVTKPYTPSARADNVTFMRRESSSVPGIHEVPSSLSMSSTFGTVNLSNS